MQTFSWEVEGGIRNDEGKGVGYSPIGETTVQRVNPVPERMNMVSAVSNQSVMQ